MKHTDPVVLVKLRAEDYSLSPVIQHTRWLASQMGARVCLFSSLYKRPYRSQFHELSPRQRKEEAHDLSERRRKLKTCASVVSAAELHVETTLNWKKPTNVALKEYVNAVKPDLIITSRPKATLRDRGLLFDPDWHMIQAFEAPAIFVNDSPVKCDEPYVWAAVDPTVSDTLHEELNDLIIERAKYLAAKTSATLQLFHCFGTATQLAKTAIGLSSSDYLPVQEIEQETHDRHLIALRALADRHEIPHSQIYNVPGIAQIVLPILAARKHPFFVVAGANKRSPLEQFIYGSTAKKLIHRLSGALCIVRLPIN